MTVLDPETAGWLSYQTEHAVKLAAARSSLGLAIIEALSEAHPVPPPELVAARDRLHANPPANWRIIAWEEGVWRDLFRDVEWARGRGVASEVVDAFERYAIALSETRYPGMPPGHIEHHVVPRTLTARKRTTVKVHASGHLANVSVFVDKNHHGELTLDETPGGGTLRIVEGGNVTDELYASPMPWTKWVHSMVDRLAKLPTLARQATARRRSRA